MSDKPMTTAGLQAKVRLRQAWFEAHPNQPMPEGRAEVDRLIGAIEKEAHRAAANAFGWFEAEFPPDTSSEPEPPALDVVSELRSIREAMQEATGAMAATLPVILAVREWRDTPRVDKKGETARQLSDRLERAILDAMDGLDDYAEQHPEYARLTPTSEKAEPR